MKTAGNWGNWGYKAEADVMYRIPGNIQKFASPKVFWYLRINDLNEGDPLFFFFQRLLPRKCSSPTFFGWTRVTRLERRLEIHSREEGDRGPATSRILTRGGGIRRRRRSSGHFLIPWQTERGKEIRRVLLPSAPNPAVAEIKGRDERRRWKIRTVTRKSLKLCETPRLAKPWSFCWERTMGEIFIDDSHWERNDEWTDFHWNYLFMLEL